MSAAGPATAEFSEIRQDDFSGGWNCRDAPSEVAENESPDCVNVTLDERGGAVKRLGLSVLADTLAGVAQTIFYWETEQLLIFQIGADVYKGASFASVSLIHTFNTDDAAGFCDFLSQLVVVHPQDGVFVYTTSGGWSQSSGSPNNMEYVRGHSLASWQNACWVIGDPRPGFGMRTWRCEFGDPTTWDVSATGAWADVREKDDAPLTAFGTQGGQDIVGRPGLIVTKDESVYRINDPDTMAYTTLHAQAGASGRLAITDLLGLTCMVNKHGIWATDGQNEPGLVSEKIAPLFRKEQLEFSMLDGACAGVKDDRVVFSLPRRAGGATPAANNFTLEYHPRDGWIVPHDFGCAAFTTFGAGATDLYGMSATDGSAFNVFRSGADAGDAITARYQTKWFEPSGGLLNRYRRLRLSGRGAFSLYVKRDYSLGQGDLVAVDFGADVAKWNDGSLWNQDGLKWGPAAYEGTEDFYSLGVGKAISLVFQHTGSSSATGPRLQQDGPAREVGAFAVYKMLIDFIRLGAA